VSREKDNKINKSARGWRRALEEAERQILEYKRKLYELNRSVKIMREKIASREVWPGDSATRN
jgi:hypothetical protein